MRTKTPQQADKMLNAAARLFATQRFHEVRMEDIAAEAAVGKGTLYRYFSDKEELYLAMLERASGQAVHRIRKELEKATGPRCQLVAFVAALIDFFDEQPHVFDLIQRAEVLHRTGQDFPWQKARDELMRIVLELFEAGQAQGDFTVRDPETARLMLLGGVRAVIRFGHQPRPGDLAKRIVDGFLAGVCPGERTGTDGMGPL